jgi:hypothetical protein
MLGMTTQTGRTPAILGVGYRIFQPRYRTWLAVLPALAGFLISWEVIHHGRFIYHQMIDTPVYSHYAGEMKRGRIPYLDFAFEYPPLALPIFLIPALFAGNSFTVYTNVFQLMMLICGLVSVGLAAYVLVHERVNSKRLIAGIALGALTPVLMGSVILSRYDLWPTALTIAALAALYFGKTRTGFVMLALGFAAKAYPIVILPLAVIYVWRNAGRRKALACVAIFAGVVLVCFLPFLIVAPHGVWASIQDQSGRPLQIESIGASLWVFAHQVFGTPLHSYFTHGSDNLDSHPAAQFAPVMSVLQAAALLAVWFFYAAGRATRERLLVASTAAVCAFIVFDRVLSPQYLIWLAPLVMLVPGRRGYAATGLLALAMCLTQVWFPQHFAALRDFLPLESWAVIARNVTLLALLGTLAWPDVAIWSAIRSVISRFTTASKVSPVPHFDEA